MSPTDDEQVLAGLELDDVDEPRLSRRAVVTVLGATTALAVIASGNASTWTGALVLALAALGVFDAHREVIGPRRPTQPDRRMNSTPSGYSHVWTIRHCHPHATMRRTTMTMEWVTRRPQIPVQEVGVGRLQRVSSLPKCRPMDRAVTMSDGIDVGDEVEWKWANGSGAGTVAKRFTSRVTRTIKGTDVTRDATDDDPAFLIKQDDGDEVLKSESELSRR